jgi:hypothetical protein
MVGITTPVLFSVKTGGTISKVHSWVPMGATTLPVHSLVLMAVMRNLSTSQKWSVIPKMASTAKRLTRQSTRTLRDKAAQRR